jgi:elongation factor G
LALGRLAQEDPSFRVRTDEESGQTIISGMGELHLEILVDRMRREFNVDANVGAPQVAYREAFGRRSSKKASSSSSLVVAVSLVMSGSRLSRMKPARATSSSMRSRVVLFRANLFPRSIRGLRDALPSGVLAGFPVVDVKVTLFDGSYHDVDSNENAFRMAASMAFKDGMKQGEPGCSSP